MSKRPTPETDAVRAYEGNWDTKALRMTAHARKLERERDDAMEKVEQQRKEIVRLNGATSHAGGTPLKIALKERDEAREQAQQMSESNQVLMADVRFYRSAWEQLNGAKK